MCAAGPRPGWARLRFSCLSGFLLSLGGFLFCFVHVELSIRIRHFFFLVRFSIIFCVRVCVCPCACLCAFLVCVCHFRNVKMWVKKVKKKKTHQPSRSSEGCKGGLMQNTMTWGEEKK